MHVSILSRNTPMVARMLPQCCPKPNNFNNNNCVMIRRPRHHAHEDNNTKCLYSAFPTSQFDNLVAHTDSPSSSSSTMMASHLMNQQRDFVPKTSLLSDKEIEEERKLALVLSELASCSHETISMRRLIQFGSNGSPQTLIDSCRWLHHELKIRLAKQVKYLNEFPKGLNLMPSVNVVRHWYATSFQQVINAVPPTTMEEQMKYSEMLQEIYDRHAPTTVSVARGVHELKMEYAFSVFKSINLVDMSTYVDLHQALDNFYINRIGMRMLIGQHLELVKTFKNPQYANENYVGLICLQTSPRLVALDAIEDAREVCTRAHLDVPDVKIIGPGLDSKFPYVPSHLYYVLFELLKNSMRAVCEKHKGSGELPDIELTIADSSSNEDICIKLSDQGGGIARSNLSRIWSYLYTTANYDYSHDEDLKEAPLAGLGYGLPLSKVYCQYWGGDLNVMSMEGLGTDAYVHLNKKGDTEEPQLE